MSDNFLMLVDSDVALADASDLCKSVIAGLCDRGLIESELTADCVLGGHGYRPGPALPGLYKPVPNEIEFWKLGWSGVEPRVERAINYWALGPACEGFTCPKCSAWIKPFDETFGASMMAAITEWVKETGPAELACPHCKQRTPVTHWHADTPFGFGNLSFTFYNWPPFECTGWSIDIPQLLREMTGHQMILTWGHI